MCLLIFDMLNILKDRQRISSLDMILFLKRKELWLQRSLHAADAADLFYTSNYHTSFAVPSFFSPLAHLGTLFQSSTRSELHRGIFRRFTFSQTIFVTSLSIEGTGVRKIMRAKVSRWYWKGKKRRERK